MPTDRVVVREIAWRDIFPWLILFRTFRLAKSLPVLFLATLGAMLTPLGWRAAENFFLDETIVGRYDEFSNIVWENRRWPGERNVLPPPNDGRTPSSVQDVLTTTPDSVQPVFLQFIRPWREMIGTGVPLTRIAYYAFGALWMLLVWALFGGAITRMAAMRLGREERIGLGEAVRFAVRKLGSYIASPLFPLLGVAMVAVPIFLLGLLIRSDWGALAAGILWVFVLLGGLIITWLLLGLLFGWPLMWVTVSSEQTGDAFEAFSRSYSYTYQRPLHYLFYTVLAVVYGGFCWLVVYHFSEAVIGLCDWPAALGAGSSRWSELMQLRDNPSLGSGVLSIAGYALAAAVALVRAVATGFGYSLFWCLATAIYLLLRYDVDQTEFDEVYVENEDRRYELPSLGPKQDERAEELSESDQQAQNDASPPADGDESGS
jgi:hypothetical protein